MPASKRSVLITGCSDGGLGAALAMAFHNAGFHVYATARNTSKMKTLESRGIETLTLDVLSEQSIATCVSKISSLDILVNNAGAAYSMPFSDISISEAKQLFDLNVWSYLSVTQAFLPLLLKSKGMVVNHTSSASVVPLPFQSTYNASKAAIAMFSDCQRLELAPFGVTVIDLKTGGVQSNIGSNQKEARDLTLPKNSIFKPTKEVVEKAMRGELIERGAEGAAIWAKNVVHDLMKKRPPPVVWRGAKAGLIRLSTVLPFGTLDGTIKQATGLDVVEKTIHP